jgi:hypothetical protein
MLCEAFDRTVERRLAVERRRPRVDRWADPAGRDGV